MYELWPPRTPRQALVRFAMCFAAGLALILIPPDQQGANQFALVAVLVRRLFGIGLVGGSFVYLALAWILSRN